jgi:hypothetical protein
MQALLRQMREQRQEWVDIGDGRAVCVRRPHEADFPGFARGGVVDHVATSVCDWRGMTEAALLGAGVGGDDAVPFAPELWAEWVRDRADIVQMVARALVGMIERHLASRRDDAGNSPASSPSPTASS